MSVQKKLFDVENKRVIIVEITPDVKIINNTYMTPGGVVREQIIKRLVPVK